MDHYNENSAYRKVFNQDEMLISIVVLTYNSAKYVIETLDSAKAQTYNKIELIISDDHSIDNTLDICAKWIKENKERFVRAELITAEENTGIPANCNRGVKTAKGVWLKMIAGDDILDNQCIEYFIDHLSVHPDISIIALSTQYFDNTFRKENFGILIEPEDFTFFHSKISAEQQYDILLRKCRVRGSSIIVKKETILNVGGFDEKYRWIEDWPFFLKLTKAGYKIHALNKLAVYYRRHDSSVLSDPKTKIFSDFYRKTRQFHLDYMHPNITTAERFADNIDYLRHRTFDSLGLNRSTNFCKWLFSITARFNPSRIISDYALRKASKIV